MDSESGGIGFNLKIFVCVCTIIVRMVPFTLGQKCLHCLKYTRLGSLLNIDLFELEKIAEIYSSANSGLYTQLGWVPVKKWL